MFFAPVALAAALSTTDAATIEATLTRWESAARDMKSLHVEYTTETKIAGEEQQITFELRALKTTDGLFVDLVMRSGNAQTKYLLRDNTVWAIDTAAKRVTRFQTKDALQFMADYHLPVVMLLDRARTEKAYSLSIHKTDEWYFWLALTPKDAPNDGPIAMVAVPHRENNTLPVGMPRSAFIRDLVGLPRWDVTKWVMNGANPPKVEEFALPTEEDGWTITEWTWPPKWKTSDRK